MCLENETGSTHADSPELLFHRPGLFLYGTLWRRRGRTAHGVSEIKQEAQQRIQTKLGLKFGSSGTMRVLTHGGCSAFFCTCSSSESLRVTKRTGSLRDENSNNKLSSASSSAQRQEVVKARKSPAPLSVDKSASAVTCVGLFGEQRRRRLQLQTALHLQTQNTGSGQSSSSDTG